MSSVTFQELADSEGEAMGKITLLQEGVSTMFLPADTWERPKTPANDGP